MMETDSLLVGRSSSDGGSRPPAAGSTTIGDHEQRSQTVVWAKLGALVLVLIVVFSSLIIAFSFRFSGNGPAVGSSQANHEELLQYANKAENGKFKAPRYTATQLISFTINTLGGLDAHGECVGRSVDENGVCYLGNANNLTEDVFHRMKIVEEVLNRLVDNPDVDQRDDVLKVCMFPEFFLRGPYGAYSTVELDDGGILAHVGIKVRELIKAEKFSNFLFVLGTIIAARSAKDPNPLKGKVLHGDEILYFNYAPVGKGGPNTKQYFHVTKKYISTADFLGRTSLPDPRKMGILEYGQEHEEFSNLTLARLKERHEVIVQDNLLLVDGVRIGIEICLDHRMGVLWDSLKHRKKAPKLVDVHLITSAGMSIKRGPNPVVPGGVVYLTDGGASSAACQRIDTGKFEPEHVCRDIGRSGLKHLPVGEPGYSSYFTMAKCVQLLDFELLKGYYSLYQHQGCAHTLDKYGIHVLQEYEYYPPSIEIYPTVPLPTRRTHHSHH